MADENTPVEPNTEPVVETPGTPADPKPNDLEPGEVEPVPTEPTPTEPVPV